MEPTPVENRRSDSVAQIGANLLGHVGNLGNEEMQFFLSHPETIAVGLKMYHDGGRNELMKFLRRSISGGASAVEADYMRDVPNLAVEIDREFRNIGQWISGWPIFCQQFGLAIDVDFPTLANIAEITGRRGSFDALVYCPRGLTTMQTVELYRRQSDDIKIASDMYLERYTLERSPDETDVVLCRPDVDIQGWNERSADELAMRNEVCFLDVRERIMLQAFYFWLTKRLTKTGLQLDVKTWTHCVRSRDPDNARRVACAFYDANNLRFEIYWLFSHMSDADSGSGGKKGGREAIPVKQLTVASSRRLA
jgi:hypothetical protein